MAVVGCRALPTQKIHQAPVMLGCDVDEAAAGVPACGMGQRECAVNPALGFELTLDLDPVSRQEREIGGNLEALGGEIYEGAEAGGSVAVHETPPIDGDAKVLAWIGHDGPFIRDHAGLLGNAGGGALDARRRPAVVSNVPKRQCAGYQWENKERREHDYHLNEHVGAPFNEMPMLVSLQGEDQGDQSECIAEGGWDLLTF
ncbi:MAG: hypothetical protein AAB034_00840 [Nitrospirota bacterium]